MRKLVFASVALPLFAGCGSVESPGSTAAVDAAAERAVDDDATTKIDQSAGPIDAGLDASFSPDVARVEVDAGMSDSEKPLEAGAADAQKLEAAADAPIAIDVVTVAHDGAPDVIPAPDAGADAKPDTGPACTAGVACTTNPGGACFLGVTSCTAGGAVSCVDGAKAPDGTTCTTGLCSGGACLQPVTASANLNLTTTALTSSRTCAEAPAYVVAGLSATAATVTSSPATGCLVPGDEVLLISLQGSPAAHDNVGNWETLTVASVSGASVTFATAKTRFYGATAGSDQGVGTGATDQKVALIRVPHFGALTVGTGVEVSAAPWDGSTGGVVALRVASLRVDGTISAASLGYRSGRWSSDGTCHDNLTTEAGESITGAGSATTAHNAGGAGGLGAITNVSFNSNTPMSSTAGHASPGEAGTNANGREMGEPGGVYGAGDATRLTMGSGSGGNVTCGGTSTAAEYISINYGKAGGIVLIFAGDINVTSTGSISATPVNAARDTAAAGGYVFLSGRDLTLGDGRVTAKGAIALGGSPPTSTLTRQAGSGYIVLQGRTVTGSTAPAGNRISR